MVTILEEEICLKPYLPAHAGTLGGKLETPGGNDPANDFGTNPGGTNRLGQRALPCFAVEM